MLWSIAVFIVGMFYVAYKSGEHHGERAKRIVERNRVERKKKWVTQARKIKELEMRVKNLRKLLER